MQDQPFHEPVIAFADDSENEPCQVVIVSLRDAYDLLMNKHYQAVGDVAWHLAVEKVLRALLDPSPGKLDEARIAFCGFTTATPMTPEHRRAVH